MERKIILSLVSTKQALIMSIINFTFNDFNSPSGTLQQVFYLDLIPKNIFSVPIESN